MSNATAAILCEDKIERRMQISLRNCELHVTPIKLCNTIRNDSDIKNSSINPRSLQYSFIQPYHLQADLIWCDGTFKVKTYFLQLSISVCFPSSFKTSKVPSVQQSPLQIHLYTVQCTVHCTRFGRKGFGCIPGGLKGRGPQHWKPLKLGWVC